MVTVEMLQRALVEAGYDLEMEHMRLGELIETTVEASQVPASQQDVALSADLPGTALWVTGNRRRLRQVFSASA